jgi:hypothetical protein
MNRSALALTLALLICLPVDGMGQRRRPGASVDPSAPLTLSARIHGKTYRATGPGSCKHTPDASIYDLPAALWMIEFRNRAGAQIKQLNLTLWRPKDGTSDQISLSLETGSSSYRMASGGRAPVGRATVKLSPLGAGGRFEVKGKDGEGTSIQLTVSCPAFAGVEAEGG